MKRGMRPAHPGALIKETIEGLKEETGHNCSQGEIAKGFGVYRRTLSNILNEHQGVSSEMCIRLFEVFGTSAEFWLNVHRNYDLWHAERSVERKTVQHFGRFLIAITYNQRRNDTHFYSGKSYRFNL